ncbi:MAG: EI24 domain-containing protein [Myxococcales bacterium]|nr:EI24 domain-containing protein [Myxococcales bacterium]MCB9648070.1 EI24 domain-containing protein [Deltaproteobacteria bacterium]
MSEPSFLIRRGLKPGLGGFFTGVGAVFWGLSRVLSEPRLRRLALVPLFLTAVLYMVLMALTVWQGPGVVDWIWSSLDWGREAWWQLVLFYAAVVAGVLGLLVLLILLFSSVAEAVGGPFYDKMASHVLGTHGIPTKEPGLIEGTVPDLIRSVLFMAPAAVCWILGFIPVVGVAFWVLGGAVVWLGFASAAVNPALSVTGNGLGARVSFVFRFFFTMLGVGGVVAVAMLVPLLGLVAIPASIVGTTELYARSHRAM